MVYVFNSAAMVNPIASNRGSGHGNNCCITVNLNAGVSYYFVIQGTSSTTAGTFGLRFYRGLPMSGSEKPTYKSEFEEDHGSLDSNKYRNNCYTYSLSMWREPLTGYAHPIVIMPGVVARKMIDDETYEYEIYNASNADEILELIRDDLEHWGYPRNYIVECGETDIPPEGYYKIALFYGQKGFHFVRQVSDRNGAWAYKDGIGLVKYIDDNSNSIFNPRNAVFNYHKNLVSFYAVKSIDYIFD